jgi:hypothetical protein
MADYVSNCPVSGPRGVRWKAQWDIGGMAWSHEWGMFYDVPDDDPTPMRKPTRPVRGDNV